MTGSYPTPLRELAAQAGILSEYINMSGETCSTSDETRRAFLAALGTDASTDEGIRAALAASRASTRERMIPVVRVVRETDPLATLVAVHSPASGGIGRWRLDVRPEVGEPLRLEGPWRGDDGIELTLPSALPLGYHRIRVTLTLNGREWRNEQTLIIVPSHCVMPETILGDRRAFGLIANLYTVRSATNWGIGDFGDLAALGAWGGAIGADFVGVNPLHALLNRGPDVGPYSPVSRIFRNPIYIDVSRVPELSLGPDVREWVESPRVTSDIIPLRESPSVQYEAVMEVKGRVLSALHHVFLERIHGTGHARALAYDEFVAGHEPWLTRFATWMTIAEEHGREWRRWPAQLHDPASDAAKRHARQHADRVDYHRWLQFEADRQLGDAFRTSREAGMRIGLYQDLAIGTAAASADTWAFPGLFVPGVTVGAPADPYSAIGQNWSLPPIDPRALKAGGYEYFIKLLRGGFRNSGALRIDHVMGLFRLFWIPEDKDARSGAYVRYPSEDLLGILALESQRHNAIVVGEDLGTVPAEVPGTLARWGVLSSKVFYFERDVYGEFKPPGDYPRHTLATANTHDMPTIAGFWMGRDIDTRERVGLFPSQDAVDNARAERERERAALVRRLAAERIIPDEAPPASGAALTAAVHAFLARTPAELIGLSLDDLGGEMDAVNVPGVGPDRHPSWTRKMRLSIEEIARSEDARAALPMAPLAN